MTVLIIEVKNIWNDELGKVLDHFFEALEYEARTGFITRVALKQFDKNHLPVYWRIPDDELTYAEWRNNVNL